MYKRVAKVLFTILLIVSGIISADISGQPRLDNPKPIKAVDALINAFDRYPLVALGEAHWSQTEHEFVYSLIKHPDFANKVNDIVVEFGNALYQPIMDRYIAGETVARTELRQVWRNTTQVAMMLDAPIYERFFATVRAVNQTLPKQKQLRVLLGDPPIDWDAIKSGADLKPAMFNRDVHCANVIGKEALDKGRKALLFYGGAHLIRQRPMIPNITIEVEKRHPGAVFVVMPHLGFGERNEELEKRLESWPKPGVALVKNTWLGDLDPGVAYPPAKMIRLLTPDGGETSALSLWEGMKFQDMTDAYLYLGPKDSMVIDDTIPPEARQDEEYQRELQRRRQLLNRPAPRPIR